MHVSAKCALLGLALTASALPIEEEKRQLGGGLGSLTGGSSSGGLGGLSGGLGGLSGGTGTGGLGSLASGLPSSTGGGLGSLTGGGGLGSLSSGLPSAGSGGLGGLSGGLGSLSGGSSGGLGGLGSLGGGSGTGALPSGIPSAGGSSGGLGSLTGGGDSGSGLGGLLGGGASGVSSSGACADYMLFFARGTGEPGGTLGTIVGPKFASDLKSGAGGKSVSAQGVDYPASAAGNAELGGSGGPQMAALVKPAMSKCPNAKIVLSGYSQGAMVVHNALSAQGVDGSKVAAVVEFGDPLQGESFKGVQTGRVKEFCGSSDFICDHGGSDMSGSHLSYGNAAQPAAQFVLQVAGQ